MRVAVLSDIHANQHALEAVLAESEGCDAVWCLGDVVGYGPRPNECVELVRRRADLCLAGNHDLAVIGTVDLDDFGGEAGEAARWTRDELTEESRRFLAGLEPSGEAEGIELYHGSPRDPVWEYVLGPDAALAALATARSQVVLIGHSHVALAISLHGRDLTGGVAPGGAELDLGSGRHLLNPGSVGQPRDGDPRAAWLVIDTQAGRATFCRTAYPVGETQAEMRASGLPEALVVRLEHGA